MRFTTAGYNQSYTLNPTLGELRRMANGRDPDRGVSATPGITISSGMSRTLDTEAAQIGYGWSDEDRTMMERHLMSHPDFGRKRTVDRGEQRGDLLLNSQVWLLWFAPDQEIPDEHEEFCSHQQWFKAWGTATEAAGTPVSDRQCIYAETVGNAVLGCKNPALEGQDYCEEHVLAEVK